MKKKSSRRKKESVEKKYQEIMEMKNNFPNIINTTPQENKRQSHYLIKTYTTYGMHEDII